MSEKVQWLLDHADYSGDDCLIWPFSRVRGYGNFGLKGKQHYAHRYMCELIYGIAPGRTHEAAHSCNNGHLGCVNPRHILWKTRKENMADKKLTGASAWNGNRTVRHKLTVEQVAEIRSLAGHHTAAEMGRMYNVTESNILKIWSRKSWIDGTLNTGAGARWRRNHF